MYIFSDQVTVKALEPCLWEFRRAPIVAVVCCSFDDGWGAVRDAVHYVSLLEEANRPKGRNNEQAELRVVILMTGRAAYDRLPAATLRPMLRVLHALALEERGWVAVMGDFELARAVAALAELAAGGAADLRDCGFTPHEELAENPTVATDSPLEDALEAAPRFDERGAPLRNLRSLFKDVAPPSPRLGATFSSLEGRSRGGD